MGLVRHALCFRGVFTTLCYNLQPGKGGVRFIGGRKDPGTATGLWLPGPARPARLTTRPWCRASGLYRQVPWVARERDGDACILLGSTASIE